jgi:hypothetical protein
MRQAKLTLIKAGADLEKDYFNRALGVNVGIGVYDHVYTHVTSRCFVRHKLDNQIKAQHEYLSSD